MTAKCVLLVPGRNNNETLKPPAKEIEEEEEYLEIFMINRYQAGAYQCRAANEVASPDEKQVHITVNYAPAIKYAQSADVAVGRTGMLHCEVSAVPPADFEWYKEDKRIYNSSQGIQIQTMESRSSLIVTNATEDHYGNYTCVAGNKLGVTNASIFLYKSILPTIPNPVQETTFLQTNHQMLLQCLLTSTSASHLEVNNYDLSFMKDHKPDTKPLLFLWILPTLLTLPRIFCSPISFTPSYRLFKNIPEVFNPKHCI
ncbi:limbic system-associated membrane protein-like [Hypanus sabinus]|uniref:limbic system-associated membrane protein-like n=1 Tax=Hypanus sabinus TaxID=79690 RepID=UPI0028C477F0|nr:limbic system-associated membrane protein-like [Hypanus sabinus]